MCLSPLPGPINCGESRGGPSISVGGDRKARVSEEGRLRGEGPYGDLSPVRWGNAYLKVKTILNIDMYEPKGSGKYLTSK